MIAKFLEAFFSHKLLILLPVVLIPLTVTPAAFLFNRPYFETYALVWVGRPTYLRTGDEVSPWVTPAQVEAGRIVEAMRTRSFIAEVAMRTDLAPLIGSERGESEVGDFFGKSIAVAPSTTNLVTISGRAEQPQLAVQAVNALAEAYRDRVMSERTQQAGIAISFYETRLREAQDELAKATADIRRYVAANPRLTTIDPTRGAGSTTAARLGLPPVAIDPQLAELIRRVETAQGEVDTLRKSVDQAQMDIGAWTEGLDVSFRVVDPPRVPTAPVSQRRRLAIFPAAGLVVGLGLAAGLLVALVILDRTVRSAHDLPANLRIAGGVPFLRLGTVPRQAGPHTTRRAMGFVAGTTLPAPKGVR